MFLINFISIVCFANSNKIFQQFFLFFVVHIKSFNNLGGTVHIVLVDVFLCF
nr:MAG TPA: hypothetical protein [Caudoviricetes sp.]